MTQGFNAFPKVDLISVDLLMKIDPHPLEPPQELPALALGCMSSGWLHITSEA